MRKELKDRQTASGRYTVKRAVIMAAGVGKRMHPITLKTPKPLIRVNGVRIIDTVIRGLRDNGITEIYVVVGYLKEQFRELEVDYPGLKLIDNPYYETCNNIASLYVARDYIESSIILEGDLIVYNSGILKPGFGRSGYNVVWCEAWTKEWLLKVDNDVITNCSRKGGSCGWQLFGISRWTPEDGKRLKRHLEIEFEEKKNYQIYWDDVAIFCYPQEYRLGIYKMKDGDVVEVDSVNELAALDKSYTCYVEEQENG